MGANAVHLLERASSKFWASKMKIFRQHQLMEPPQVGAKIFTPTSLKVPDQSRVHFLQREAFTTSSTIHEDTSLGKKEICNSLCLWISHHNSRVVTTPSEPPTQSFSTCSEAYFEHRRRRYRPKAELAGASKKQVAN